MGAAQTKEIDRNAYRVKRLQPCTMAIHHYRTKLGRMVSEDEFANQSKGQDIKIGNVGADIPLRPPFRGGTHAIADAICLPRACKGRKTNSNDTSTWEDVYLTESQDDTGAALGAKAGRNVISQRTLTPRPREAHCGYACPGLRTPTT